MWAAPRVLIDRQGTFIRGALAGCGARNSFGKDLLDQARWGHSSVGRALEWHSRGQGFDSPWLHHFPYK